MALTLSWQNLGWTLMEDGSIRIEEATEEALGTYTCVPYNTLGTMGQSAPARLVLKVRLVVWVSPVSRGRGPLLHFLTLPAQDPPYFTVLPGWEYRQEAGRELLIPCAAAGDPFPVITWRKVLPGSGALHLGAWCREELWRWFYSNWAQSNGRPGGREKEARLGVGVCPLLAS